LPSGSSKGVAVYLKKDLPAVEFVNIQKLFLSGWSILLRGESLSVENRARLDLFFIENRIETEEIHLAGQILCASSGDAKLMVFEADRVAELAMNGRFLFWSNVFSLLVKTDFTLEADDDVIINWKIQEVCRQDKTLQEIRRLGLYNSAGDRKKIRCSLPEGFTFLQAINQKLAKVATHENVINVELPAHSTISLEFVKGECG
jgi:hypothetical protein